LYFSLKNLNIIVTAVYTFLQDYKTNLITRLFVLFFTFYVN